MRVPVRERVEKEVTNLIGREKAGLFPNQTIGPGGGTGPWDCSVERMGKKKRKSDPWITKGRKMGKSNTGALANKMRKRKGKSTTLGEMQRKRE